MGKRRVYTVEDIDKVEVFKREYSKASIRGIAEVLNYPKTQVGNWTKDPEFWREKYRFNVPEDKPLKDEQLKQLEKFKKKVHRQRKNEPEAYKGLYIRYEDGEWTAYSG